MELEVGLRRMRRDEDGVRGRWYLWKDKGVRFVGKNWEERVKVGIIAGRWRRKLEASSVNLIRCPLAVRVH